MATVFNQSIATAANIVLKAPDRELSANNFAEKVYSKSKINVPILNLEQTKVQIKKEEISYRNAPPGMSFSLSGPTVVEYALYSIPVSGNMEIFLYLIRPFIDGRKIYLEYNVLCYKEYSNTQISGNDQRIEEIKNRVKEFTQNVNKSLSEFEAEVHKFNEIKLMPTIKHLIQTEIDNRNLKSNSEAKLNPFA